MEDKEKAKARPVKLPEIRIEWCKGCGLCIDACRYGVIAMDKLGKACVVDPGKCRGCAVCEEVCPDYAIKVKIKNA